MTVTVLLNRPTLLTDAADLQAFQQKIAELKSPGGARHTDAAAAAAAGGGGGGGGAVGSRHQQVAGGELTVVV